MVADPRSPPTPKPTQGSWSQTTNEEEENVDEDDGRTSDDIEEGLRMRNISTFETAKESIGTGKVTFSDIVNDIWHFSSLDYGRRCR
jgi:hypothetical protein